MKIYYRGYLINENPLAGPGCMVHGTRPERRDAYHRGKLPLGHAVD